MENKIIRPIAINLPQFHPIPENDLWWEKGFTEWTNVTKARPLFKGHYQPHIPADLGFYDLRLPESREAQTNLAAEYGVYGFCYYHYWFNGKQLLERPVDEILTTGKPDFPFMLCWANDNWTRKWDGLDQEILISHSYSDDDDIDHIRHLIKYFKDPRYIKVGNKPVIILYKVFLFPDPEKTAKRWREVASDFGIELYLCHMVFSYKRDWNRLVKGFDAVIDFEPFGIRHNGGLNHSNNYQVNQQRTIYNKMKSKISNFSNNNQMKIKPIYEYKSMFENLIPISKLGLKLYPSIVPGWDNSSRRKDDPSLILDESTPEYFGQWLEQIKDDFKPYSIEENFVFINAWNEWAEGNHMEPCQRWGTQYLDTLQKILKKNL